LEEHEHLEHQGVVNQLLSLIPFLKVVWSVQVLWIVQHLLSALSQWTVQSLVTFANHLLQGSLVEVILGQIL
jgi:hypothetical protein